MNRETWLNALADKMAPRFEELGHPLPKFYVSIGFPSAGKDGRAAAECWHSSASADGRFHIHIRPDEADTEMIAGHLAHELTHAAVGFDCDHKGDFAKVVLALGLKRPLTSTVPGDEFKAWVKPFLAELGPVPHASLSWLGRGGAVRGKAPAADGADGGGEASAPEGKGNSNAKPKQSTRLLKAACAHETDGQPCGYTIRLSKKWALELGAACPAHGAMEVEGMDEPDQD